MKIENSTFFEGNLNFSSVKTSSRDFYVCSFEERNFEEQKFEERNFEEWKFWKKKFKAIKLN